MRQKKNTALIVGLAIPIFTILVVIATIFIPKLFVHPKYDFLYASGNYYSGERYTVENGKLIKHIEKKKDDQYWPSYSPKKLYLHDVTNNKSEEITYYEAQRLNLDQNKKSPDGYEIVCGSRGDSFLFFFGSYSDCSTRYIKGHFASRKIDVQASGDYYRSIQFLGWVVK